MPSLSSFVSHLVLCSVDIRAVWHVGSCDEQALAALSVCELLAFGDGRALASLRKNEHLHRPDVDLLVVIDGDRFENAWGLRRLSGSLSRWAWREVAPGLAYYDESKWAEQGAQSGIVVRVRRKAQLLWQSPDVVSRKN